MRLTAPLTEAVANLKRYRDEMRAKYPNFELRANGGLMQLEERQEDPYDFDKAFEILNTDPLTVELVRDHGGVMEEIWMHYAGYGSYTNNCLNYLRASHFENCAYKMAGGHNGHMYWFYDGTNQYTPDEIYQQLFTFLGGAHLDGAFGPIVENMYDLGVYATRFSEFFWDPKLRGIPQLADKIEVDTDRDLWFAETGFQKSGCTTEECAVQIGKILNVRKMIVGSVLKSLGTYIINLRFIDVEKGVAEFAVKETAKPTTEGLMNASQILSDSILKLSQGGIQKTDYSKPGKSKPSEKTFLSKMKWPLFIAAIAGGAAGYYFDTRASASYDKYTAATDAADATKYNEEVKNNEKIRDASYITSGVLGGLWLTITVFRF